MSELHHPHCPRYFLDGREVECSASPACKCRECKDCYGTREIDTPDGEDFEPCISCDGIGRVLR